MVKTYIGIDPGLSGAMAVYAPETDFLRVVDMPTFMVKKNRKLKRQLDLSQIANIMGEWWAIGVDKAAIEEVSAMPRQGVTSSFNFGFTAGVMQMAVAAFNIPILPVAPVVWKRAMCLTKNKDDSRRMASRLLPQHAGNWPLVKHDGRAEAVLLALYLSRLEEHR